MSPVRSRHDARLKTTSLSEICSKQSSTGGQPPSSTLVLLNLKEKMKIFF